MMKRFFAGSLDPLGDREVGATVCTDQLARDGHVFEPAGVQLDNYRKNPVVLWQHDVAKPVARTTAIGLADGKLVARMKFPDQGVSSIADEICALVKANIISGISVGIDPLETEPLDPAKPRGGQRMLRADLLEISFCSVPVDTAAVVTERSVRAGRVLSAENHGKLKLAHTKMREAIGHVRDVLDAAADTPNVKEIQKSGGVSEDHGSDTGGRSVEFRRLVAAALEFGESLTVARAEELIAEARRIGRDPLYHYRWLAAARGLDWRR